MATWTAKLTATRGKPQPGDIVKGAGSAEGDHDVMSLNIDGEALTKGEALIMLDNIRAKIFAGPWPINAAS